tara:strand:+ start:1267 stop:2049 length:783 start_codon:yes stop_codon:yes gene_type:complete
MQNKPKKSLGQNFLMDKNILNKIIKIGDINKDDHILEVGPGTGNLTKLLVKSNAKKITIVEKDTELSEILNKNLNHNVQVVNADILTMPNKFYNQKYKIFGNLPYNISTQILSKWCINEKFKFDKLILMFQKEVGERIIAKVNTKNYSRLTILSNWKFNVNKICEINPSSFFPKPKVKSMLLEFTPKKSFIKIKNPKNLEKLTSFFFSERRKMVKKKFKKLFNNYENFLKKIDINETCRPQNISIEKYILIVKELEKNSD